MTCLTLLMLTCLTLQMIITSHLYVIQWMREAKVLLINKTEAALNWIEANEMIADLEKFHLTFLSPNKQDLINKQFIDIRSSSSKMKQNLHCQVLISIIDSYSKVILITYNI